MNEARLLCCLALFLFSCSTGKVISHVSGNYCAPTVQYSAPSFDPPGNTDSLLRTGYTMPVHELLMANATGTLQLLQVLQANRTDSSMTARMKRSEVRLQIQQRLMLATAQIAGIAAELDCEGEKADQLAKFLDDMNAKRNTRLTVASIVAGALTTIATVAIKENGPQNAVAIGGGLLSAGLGAMTINAAGKRTDLQHSRNLLHDIWYTPASSGVYPPFIWYVLNEKRFSNSGQVSLAENIRQRWKELDLDNKVSKEDEALFFGNGGIYTADKLHTRAAMVNELQATIRSLNQDLQNLLQYLTAIE